jgi:geranylgeranylglycerol-phosphate geranylgeranyltransferase
MLKKIDAYLKIMRPLNLFQGGIAILVCLTLANPLPRWWQVLLAILIVWAYTGAGNTLNDYYDREIDKINRPQRPIPAGLISPRQALAYAWILFGLGTLAVLPVFNRQIAVIIPIALFFLVAYTPVFKSRPLWGNLIVSGILGMTFLFGSAIFGDMRPGIVPCCLAFGFNFIREVIKDMQDVKGDQAQGARTFPLVFGLEAARSLVVVSTVVLMLGALVPFFLKIYGLFYLIVLVLTVEIPLGLVIFSIRRDYAPTNCGRLAALLKGDVFFGLLAIFVGRF